MDRFDGFLSNLYRSTAFVRTDQFREWALQQLREILPFDAALWGSGSLTTPHFHTITLLDLSDEYPKALERTNAMNPVWSALMAHRGEVVDARALMPDAEFYSSQIYRECFSRFGIERLLSTLHNQPRSGLVTLLSIYRHDRDRPFSKAEKACFSRAVEHLVSAASHAYFTHLLRRTPSDRLHRPAAVCDIEGYLYEVQPHFVDMLEDHFPDWQGPRLPFELPGESLEFVESGLCGKLEPLDDLLCLQIWPESPLDSLTERECEVVTGVCQGLTFKEIARASAIAPSTVSNHLYRIYRKLGINSRSALAELVSARGGTTLLDQQPTAAE